MEIKISCETKLYLPLENIKDFQGALKTLDPDKKEKLKKQILEQGFAAPIFVWKNDGKYYCLDGTQRRVALQDLKSTGYKIPDLPCVEIHAKTKREAKKKLLSYVSQFGKVTGAGLYEFINEAELDLKELEDFEIPEIDLEDFKEEFFPEDKPVGDGSEDEIPEVSLNELGVKLGDIFELGNHRLMCGDSTDLATVEKLMNGEKADISFTSPPYNAERSPTQSERRRPNHQAKKYENHNDAMSVEDYKQLISKSLYNAQRFVDYQLVNIQHLAGNKIALLEWLYDFRNNFVDTLIWFKEHGMPQMAEKCLNSAFEYIYIFSKDNKPSKAIKTATFRNIDNVYVGKKQTANEFSNIHAATFPLHLPEFIVSNFCPIKGSVLDLFLGTGTTIIACEKTNRKCYGMELDPHYCSVIIKRWEEYTGKKHKKLT